MISLNVKGDIRAVIRDLDKIQRRVVPAATVTALNTTNRKTEASAVRRTSQALRLPLQAVRYRFRRGRKTSKRRILLTKATRARMFARLRLFTSMIPAIVLGAQQTRTGVRAKRHRFPHAFIAPNTKHGGRYYQVWKRTGRSRYPIEVQAVELVPTATVIFEQELRKARPTMQKELERQIRRRLRMR